MLPCHTAYIMLTILIITLTLLPAAQGTEQADGQILKRVVDHLQHFMDAPVRAINRAQKYLEVGGFPNDLQAIDRDITSMYLWMELPIYLYFGLEDGTFTLYDDPLTSNPPRPALFHRQPGYSGYPTDPVPEESIKHWISCVEEDGTPINCTLPEGKLYVKCIDDCKLERCETIENSQLNCTALSSQEERVICEESVTWCPQYTIETVKEGEKLGTVPSLFSCVNEFGAPEQTPGRVLAGVTYDNDILGNCYFSDGVTVVNRTLVGDYASCNEGEECNPFIGTYMTREYDPRYRPWYIGSKALQKPQWTEPYPFFGQVSVGITYTEPMFAFEDSRKVFKGVFAIDYTLGLISDFLSQYQGSNMLVAVIEASEPNYIIAVSTGSVATKLVLKDDTTKPCSDYYDPESCTVIRVPLENLDTSPDDFILQKAFAARATAGFPVSELVSFKRSDELGDQAYISQGDIFEQANANLKWHVVVVTPMEKSLLDAAYVGSASFYIILTTAVVGFIFCTSLFISFFSFRNQRAAQNADWRFTCAFILGCAMLNLSSLALLGENRHELCMLRMWLFNLFFATALSPLFVKVWRMHRLLHASKHFRRVNVTNIKAMLFTLPIILAEAVILVVFSFVDPSRAVEELGVADLEFGQVHSVTCQHSSRAFFTTQVTFDACLVLIGCYLSYETRKLDSRFGEAKQLAFAMYNIALTGVVLMLITGLVEMDQTIKLLLQAIGVAWGTMFNSAAFVGPRLMEVHRQLSIRKRRSSVHYDKKFVLRGNLEVLVSSDSIAGEDDTNKGVTNNTATESNQETQEPNRRRSTVRWGNDLELVVDDDP